MTEIINPTDESRQLVQLEDLPKTALQAIYHAVTGKTENMSADLKGSVLIESKDVDILYGMITDQLGHYEKVFEPTVTVVVKHADDKTVTYSSWGRFKKLNIHHLDITSEVILKVESVIRLPDAPGDQRLILNISLDSALPVLEMAEKDERFNGFSWFLFLRSEWRTVKVNVDFVDFLVAKILTAVVEEWFKGLRKMPKSRVSPSMFRYYDILRTLSGQSGRFGVAAFLGSFAWIKRDSGISINQAFVAGAISLALWALIATVRSEVFKAVQSRLGRNIIPTIILLTDGDCRAFDRCKARQRSFSSSAVALIGTVVGSIIINIIASVVYARM